MRELYIVFSICCGKQCLSLFIIPVVLNIVCAPFYVAVQVVIY